MKTTGNSAFLLDTQVWVWWLNDDDRLPDGTLDMLNQAGASKVFLSLVSIWEIILLQAKDIAVLNRPALYFINQRPLTLLGLEVSHLRTVSTLPREMMDESGAAIRHKDPFDRMLVAQALAEDLTLVSADGRMPLYIHAVGLKLLTV